MMSLLCETTHFLKMPVKKLFEHSGCGNRSFPLKFKHPKANAIREFPRGCDTRAPQVSKTQPETFRNSKSAGPTSLVKPSGILLPRDLNSDSVKQLALLERVEAMEQNNTVKMEAPKVFEKGKSANVEDLGAQIKHNDDSSNLKSRLNLDSL